VYPLHIHKPGTGTEDHSYLHFTTGDTVPTYDANKGMTIGFSAAQEGKITVKENNSPLHVSTNHLVRMTVLASGEVGIGTSSPTNNLEVFDATLSDFAITTDNPNDATFALYERGGSWTDEKFGEANTNGFQFAWDGGDNKLYLKSGNATTVNTRVTFQQDGNVGIGTTSPSVPLDVAGNVSISSNAIVGNNLTVTGNTSSTSGDFSTSSGSIETTGTGNIQTTGTGKMIPGNTTADRVVVTNGSKELVSSTVTKATLEDLPGRVTTLEAGTGTFVPFRKLVNVMSSSTNHVPTYTDGANDVWYKFQFDTAQFIGPAVYNVDIVVVASIVCHVNPVTSYTYYSELYMRGVTGSGYLSGLLVRTRDSDEIVDAYEGHSSAQSGNNNQMRLSYHGPIIPAYGYYNREVFMNFRTYGSNGSPGLKYINCLIQGYYLV